MSRTTGIASLLGKREVRERSIWEASETNIRALRYDYRRTGTKEREVEVVFDWSAGRVTNFVNGETWHMDVPRSHLRPAKPHPRADARSRVGSASLELPNRGRRQAEDLPVQAPRAWNRLSTPLGSFEALVVERSQPGATRRTTFWFAPAFDFLPVQIEHREDKGSIIVRIRDVSGFEVREGGS